MTSVKREQYLVVHSFSVILARAGGSVNFGVGIFNRIGLYKENDSYGSTYLMSYELGHALLLN